MGSMTEMLEQRPKWVPVQEIVPENSIGRTLVSQIADLGLRLRPETTFQQPLPSNSILGKDGIFNTYEDILKLSFDESARLVPKFHPFDRLNDYLKGLLITPHSRLLEAAYKRPQAPVPPDREQEIVEGVEGMLGRLASKRAIPVLVLNFGLHDGITRSLKEVHEQIEKTVSYARVNQLKAIGLLRLRHPALRADSYLVLPEASFGRKTFGAVLGKDLPVLDEKAEISNLDLPSDVLKALEVNSLPLLKGPFIWNLLFQDLREFDQNSPVFNWVEQGISVALQKRAADISEQRTKAAEKESKDSGFLRSLSEQERRTQIEKRWGNYITKFQLSLSQLESVDEVPLLDLGLSTRAYGVLIRVGIREIGQLLRLNREDVLQIRNVGVKIVNEIEEKLAALLKSEDTGK